ncbi:MAG: type II/IV secretion system protein, partial [Planctomycetota bacterium]
GCVKCNGTGGKGRVAIFEMLTLSSEIKDMIFENASTERIRKQAMKEGMRTLRLSAMSKAFQGMITLEEASLYSGRA